MSNDSFFHYLTEKMLVKRTFKSKIILKPAEIKKRKYDLAKIREKIASLGLTKKDIQDAIRWARKKV